MAVVGGTRKNKLDVLDAVPIFIKYIKIVNAPKDTITICHPIDKIKEVVKFIYDTSNNNDAKNKNIDAATAW